MATRPTDVIEVQCTVYDDLKDVEEDAVDIEQAASRIQDSLREISKKQDQDVEETVIPFPGRRVIVVEHPRDETKTRLGNIAHLVDSTDDAFMYKVRREDVWQSPHEVLEELLDEFRSVLPSRSPHLEEWIERRWEQAHQFTLRTHPDGFTVLEAESAEAMKDVARRKLEHNTHYVSHLSDTESRVTKDAEADVKQVLYDAGYPVQDRRELESGADLDVKLEEVDLREYQNEWVDRFMDVGSGVFVGPSGSGKTVASIGVMNRVGGETLILVPKRELARQWKRELVEKTNLRPRQIGEYHGEKKQIRPVTIATYHTAGDSRHRKLFKKREWGLIIYDEVHHIPSKIYKRTANLQAKHRLGLSASPVREDKKEKQIFTLVGQPIGTNWTQLFEEGFVQEPEVEIRYVPWSSDTKRQEYQNADGHDRLQKAAMNPAKLGEVKQLLEKHRSEKTLIFVDYIDHGETYSEELGVPFYSGETSDKQRQEYIEKFRSGDLDTLIVSRVADEGIDLPDAEVAILASGLGGSRRQGAQRAGRTMRPYGDSTVYVLGTKGSNEEDFVQRQMQHLQEKGVKVTETDAGSR
ncbi:DEAD/DEAH box helicase [Haloarcula japonica]|uniref:DEAD/DEAH box helicase n=1 Tax=Haloarcula japonica TaxID=29282 RepID=UPI0039F741E3